MILTGAIPLLHAGTVSGVVLHPDGTPMPGIRLDLVQIGGESGPWQATTGTDGRYSVSDAVLFGNIRVTASAPALTRPLIAPAFRDLFFDINGTADFSVHAAGWVLSATNSAGAPLSGVSVTAIRFDPAPELVVERTTDASGRAWVPFADGPPGSKWRFRAHDPVRLYGSRELAEPADRAADQAEPIVPVPFTQVPGIPVVFRAAGYWADYDGDGRTDVLFVPDILSSGGSIKLFRQSKRPGDDAVSFVPVAFAADLLSNGAAVWRDFDNDGKLDVAILGSGNLRVYLQRGDQFAVALSLPAPRPMGTGSLAAGDIDNDGLEDLVVTGADPTTAFPSTILLRNLGGGNFAAPESLIPIAGAAAFVDLDGDGDLDLVNAGIPRGGPNSTVYRNENGQLVPVGPLPVDLGSGTHLVWTDIDGDGLPDFAAGLRSSIVVARNTGGGNFTVVKSIDVPANRSTYSIAWGDSNNDGIPELLTADPARIFQLLPNRQPAFLDTQINTNATHGAWVDIDGDGTLDAALTGNFLGEAEANRYGTGRQFASPNLPPTAPGNPRAVADADSVRLTWDLATDDSTPVPSLTYNVRVGTQPGGVDIVAPESDPVTGRRRIFEPGAAGTGTWRVRKLKPGVYHWAVQAIDLGFEGGPWSVEQTFTIPGAIVPTIVSFGRGAGDSFTLVLRAPEGRWQVEASSNLLDWTPVGEAAPTEPGLFGFTDTQPASEKPRFYRARTP